MVSVRNIPTMEALLMIHITFAHTFFTVPYVNPAITGSISGIVGAGGNVGGVAFATIFRQFYDRKAFSAMGWTAMISAVLTFFSSIRGHAALCCGSDAPEVMNRRKSHADLLGSMPRLDCSRPPTVPVSIPVERDTSSR